MHTRYIVAAMLWGGVTGASAVEQPLAPPELTLTNKAGQPTLVQFVKTTIERNPLVQAARSELDASTSYQAAAARPLYNPELELEAEDTDVETRTIGISQTIDWSGKRRARKSVAEAERLAVEADYQLIRRDVTTELLTGLASYQTAVDRTALAKERTDLMEEFAQLAKRRFDAGDLARVDFNLANLVTAEARIKYATAASELADARQTVGNVTPFGSQSQWPSLQTTLASPAPLKDAEARSNDLPEVNAARNRMQAAIETVSLRRREKRMDPTIGVSGGDEGGESLVGITLSVPLPVRNRFQHEVTAAMAEQRQAQQLFEDAKRRASARLSNSYQRYQISHTAWQQWLELGQENLQQQIDQLKRLWTIGELSTTEFLVQMGQSLDNRDSALDLRLALWRSWFEWQAASGQLDQWLVYKAGGPTNEQ